MQSGIIPRWTLTDERHRPTHYKQLLLRLRISLRHGDVALVNDTPHSKRLGILLTTCLLRATEGRTHRHRPCIVPKRLEMSDFFLRLVAPSFWLSDWIHHYTIPRGTPSAGTLNKPGFRIIRSYRAIYCYILETVSMIIIWNVNVKLQTSDPSASISMTLSNLQSRDARVHFYRGWYRLTNITHVERSTFVRDRNAPTQCTQILGIPTNVHRLTRTTEIGVVTHLRERVTFLCHCILHKHVAKFLSNSWVCC